MTMFMVLSSWQSHCESSPGSFDEQKGTAARKVCDLSYYITLYDVDFALGLCLGSESCELCRLASTFIVQRYASRQKL